MVRPALRSRSLGRHKVKLPGNTSTIHYEKRRPSAQKCPITGMEIHGVPRARQAEVRHTTKSQRSPNRMYGGHYSHKAVKDAIRKSILNEMNLSTDLTSTQGATEEQ